jgi:hypothetical protein
MRCGCALQKGYGVAVEMALERIDGKVPERLNEALSYAVARIEQDPDKVKTIVSRLGWDGRQSEAEPDRPLGGAPEHEKELVGRAIDRLREDGFVPDAVERAIAVAEQSLPILEQELCEALLNAKLCFVRFGCDALMSAAAVFREHPPFEFVRVGRGSGLVRPGTGKGIGQLAAAAQNLMRTRGCANIHALTDRAREIYGPGTTRAFAEAAVRTIAHFEWLDRESGWFWYMPDGADDPNRLASQIKRIMAVAPRIRLAELRSAIRRDHALGSFAPPRNVLASICKRLRFTHVEGDAVVRMLPAPQWKGVLDSDEAALVAILQAHGSPLPRAELLERARERGINDKCFGGPTLRSALLQSPAPDMYALVGTDVAPLPPMQETAPVPDHGNLSEGRMFLALEVDSSALQSGALRVPVSPFAEGDFRLETAAGDALGSIHIHQWECWDVRALLRDAGADIGDVLVLIISPGEHAAIGLIGDRSTAASVTSGEFDAALAKQATNLAALLDSLPKNNSVESSGSET